MAQKKEYFLTIRSMFSTDEREDSELEFDIGSGAHTSEIAKYF